MDLNRKQFSIDVAGESLTIEVSRIAEQASAAVLGRYGGTAVLTTVVIGREDKETDYFPLTVQYEERFYAAGKILGSRFVRREGRPSDQAVLLGRLVDRTIRPLFDHRMRREVQVVSTVLSIDHEHSPEFVALLTASLALAISEIPWGGPVAGIEARKAAGSGELAAAGEFIAFVAGTSNRISMIELEGIDAAEQDVAVAFEAAQTEISRLVRWQEEVVREIGKKKLEITFPAHHDELKKKIKAFIAGKLETAVYAKDKMKREEDVRELRAALRERLASTGATDKERKAAEHLFEEEIDALVHEKILAEDKRPDGRRPNEVRELGCEVGIFERVHGSALFVRGNTQALVAVTLAPPGQELMIESMEFSGKRRFLLHYNFPPYSVGETGPFRGPGRREIGHGALAHKAIRNLIPGSETFPYAIRAVSEILSSNGSSSMATVCATSLALMDAGVPLKKAVAGIAMGLMMEPQTNADDTQTNAETSQRKSAVEISPRGSASSPRESALLKYKILTDIQGPEDHYGDMDCKVAGTRDGITAIQMDVKINGITPDMLREVLQEAKAARLHILEHMGRTLPAPRQQISKYAPVILTTAIPPAKIGELIGPGGKMINGIIERTGVLSIDVEEDGKVFISVEGEGGLAKANAALAEVNAIGKEYVVGEIVEGPIVRIMEFGAIVDLGGGRDGMIHVSELKSGFVKKVEDVVKLGDRVRAKIIRVEDGRIGLSLKGVDGNK